jgi:hypothetical protein
MIFLGFYISSKLTNKHMQCRNLNNMKLKEPFRKHDHFKEKLSTIHRVQCTIASVCLVVLLCTSTTTNKGVHLLVPPHYIRLHYKQERMPGGPPHLRPHYKTECTSATLAYIHSKGYCFGFYFLRGFRALLGYH